MISVTISSGSRTVLRSKEEISQRYFLGIPDAVRRTRASGARRGGVGARDVCAEIAGQGNHVPNLRECDPASGPLKKAVRVPYLIKNSTGRW